MYPLVFHPCVLPSLFCLPSSSPTLDSFPACIQPTRKSCLLWPQWGSDLPTILSVPLCPSLPAQFRQPSFRSTPSSDGSTYVLTNPQRFPEAPVPFLSPACLLMASPTHPVLPCITPSHSLFPEVSPPELHTITASHISSNAESLHSPNPLAGGTPPSSSQFASKEVGASTWVTLRSSAPSR